MRPTDEFVSRLHKQGLKTEGLAVQDTVRPWQPEALEAVHEMLVHALTNAIDHGFVRPNWTVPASLRITAERHENTILIRVQDNGAGIDWDEVRAKATKVGLAISGEDPTELLFLEGLTTASESTETSGRGIGMSAIRALASAWEGSVSITSTKGQGSTLTISLPLPRVILEPSVPWLDEPATVSTHEFHTKSAAGFSTNPKPHPFLGSRKFKVRFSSAWSLCLSRKY